MNLEVTWNVERTHMRDKALRNEVIADARRELIDQGLADDSLAPSPNTITVRPKPEGFAADPALYVQVTFTWDRALGW